MILKGTKEDLQELDDLAVLVINEMQNSSIPQWKIDYPRYKHFSNDIEQEALYLFKENNEILGTCTILPENDPPYKTISSWIKEKSLVIHRILVHPLHRNKGIADKFISLAVELCKQGNYESIKIDTHLDNYRMRNFLKRKGFIELEYIQVMDRIAYEFVLEDNK